MPINIRIETRELERRLRYLARDIADLAVANRKAAVLLYRYVMLTFQNEGPPDGKPWAPLAAGGRYIGKKGKREFDFGARLLQDTGALRQSFEPFSDAKIAGVGARRYAPKRDRKAPEDLARIHEYGTHRIPARPMLPPRDVALALGIRAYNQHIIDSRARSRV